ncbi:hypothetical protein BASA81_005186 [Batrachochytrium salamandrivorans]|nr:hypothetical protein BASA81_005186 [Batrachochytrium salamandrivorans]
MLTVVVFNESKNEVFYLLPADSRLLNKRARVRCLRREWPKSEVVSKPTPDSTECDEDDEDSDCDADYDEVEGESAWERENRIWQARMKARRRKSRQEMKNATYALHRPAKRLCA